MNFGFCKDCENLTWVSGEAICWARGIPNFVNGRVELPFKCSCRISYICERFKKEEDLKK